MKYSTVLQSTNIKCAMFQMRFFAGAMNGVKLFASYTDGSFFALFGCVPETALRATATSLEITVKIALSTSPVYPRYND